MTIIFYAPENYQEMLEKRVKEYKQILLAKYGLSPKLWENESLTQIKKWVKWFKRAEE